MKLSLARLLVVLGVSTIACAPRTPRPRAPTAPRVATAGLEPARSLARRSRDAPDHHGQAERAAADVFRAMHADLLRCFAGGAGARAASHAYLTADVLVGADGAVRDVATTGAAVVGRATAACVEQRIARATFAPPRHGGTARVTVPFAFTLE